MEEDQQIPWPQAIEKLVRGAFEATDNDRQWFLLRLMNVVAHLYRERNFEWGDGQLQMAVNRMEGITPEFKEEISWEMEAIYEIGKKTGNSNEHKALSSSFDYSGPLTETVLMGNLAIRSYMLKRKGANNRDEFYGRKKLLWDGASMKITNFDEANQFVKRTYREGWSLGI